MMEPFRHRTVTSGDFPFLSSRFRPSSIALAFALIFAMGGLYGIDRSLTQADRVDAHIQAVEAASLVENFLAVHAEALEAFRGVYIERSSPPVAQTYAALIGSMGEYATSFQRVWVTDSSGVIRERSVLDNGEARLSIGEDIDTVSLLRLNLVATRARQLRRTQLSAVGLLASGRRGVILVKPIFVANRFLGFVGGSIMMDSLLSRLIRRPSHVRTQLLILAGTDTIAASMALGAVEGTRNSSEVDIHLPGGAAWKMVAVQVASYNGIRFLIWSVGLATLGALIVTLFHERRQGMRMAERSAELERLSAELLRANRAKSEFLANVSHELRTPLNAIVGFVELLRDGVYGNLAARQVGPVERIQSSANHLRQLVDQILDLAKMAAGRLEVHAEVIDLRSFVLDVASEVESLVNDRGLNFSIAVSASLPRIRTDPMHLRQIVLNLLSNAIKFTRTGGIAVRARVAALADGPAHMAAARALDARAGAHEGWIALQVADTGIGIAAADQGRIFDEFEQVNAGPRGESMLRGTGLGLPISRRLARLLGGELTVESELGKGSTFTVWITVEDVSEGKSSTTPATVLTSLPST